MLFGCWKRSSIGEGDFGVEMGSSRFNSASVAHRLARKLIVSRLNMEISAPVSQDNPLTLYRFHFEKEYLHVHEDLPRFS